MLETNAYLGVQQHPDIDLAARSRDQDTRRDVLEKGIGQDTHLVAGAVLSLRGRIEGGPGLLCWAAAERLVAGVTAILVLLVVREQRSRAPDDVGRGCLGAAVGSKD